MNSTYVFEKEFTKKLCDRFKFVKASFEHTKHEHPFDMFGVECGNGWNNILWELCESIEKILEVGKVPQEKFVVAQIKEKYGTLRFYYIAPNELWKQKELLGQVTRLIEQAEEKTEITCELCGKDGIFREGGWVRTLCDECEKNRYRR